MFDNAAFMQLNDEQKRHWIYGSVDSFMQIAAARDETIAKCISGWYYKDMRDIRNNTFIKAMETYKTIRPSAMMITMLENACGTFGE